MSSYHCKGGPLYGERYFFCRTSLCMRLSTSVTSHTRKSSPAREGEDGEGPLLVLGPGPGEAGSRVGCACSTGGQVCDVLMQAHTRFGPILAKTGTVGTSRGTEG